MRQDVLKLEYLKPGVVLPATVSNVVDFGAFVDIGVQQVWPMHVLPLADRFLRNPGGDVAHGSVTGRMLSVDSERGRIRLTMRSAG